MYLHNHKDFKSLVEISATKNSISNPFLVEKDYWIMHCLHSLSNIDLKLELKGGTSLSKGYGIVHRFSEDIDVKIIPEEKIVGFKVYTGKNQDKEKQRQSRKSYFDWLARELQDEVDGIISVVRDEYRDDKKFRRGAITLDYESHFSPLKAIREGVLLEVGFDETVPNKKRDITSWVFEEGYSVLGDSLTDNRAKKIACYDPRYTFVEKLQTIVSRYSSYKKGVNGTGLPGNFLRHYYDIYCLLGLEEVLEFIRKNEYRNYKKKHFRSHDTNIKNCAGFSLPDAKERQIFLDKYRASSALYYKGQISFHTILKRIEQYLHIL